MCMGQYMEFIRNILKYASLAGQYMNVCYYRNFVVFCFCREHFTNMPLSRHNIIIGTLLIPVFIGNISNSGSVSEHVHNHYKNFCYFLLLSKIFWNLCRCLCIMSIFHYRDFVFSVIVKSILQVHATKETYSITIRVVVDLFLLCNLRANVCHARLTLAMQDDYVS